MNTIADLPLQYSLRFKQLEGYRARVWNVLINNFFSSLLGGGNVVLDLGCGWGEFINNVTARTKYGMDLNQDCARHLSSEVQFLHQDCATEWLLPENSLDTVFTSNFFEHLPNKECLDDTLRQAFRCLKPGGTLICLGPNIKYLPGQYWDFYDHYLPLTELSLREALELRGFQIDRCIDRFLPYTMVNQRPVPMFFIKTYLRLPFVWRFFGKQFLVVGRKPGNPPLQ